jgi:hypothetical protein
MMQPTPVSEKKHRFAGLIWSAPKVGKTTWACTLPGKKLLINFDPDGHMSVADRDDVDVLDLSDRPAQDMIKDADRAGMWLVSDEGKQYQSVVTDSVTPLVAAAVDDAVQRGVGKSARFTPTIDAPGLPAYGARNHTISRIFTRILRATSQNGQHCFFMAHMDDPERDNDGNVIQQTMQLSPKIRNDVGLRISEIYHMDIDRQGRRKVYLTPFGLKQPMGSRLFNTNAVKQFDLKYDPEKPDDTQADTLANIFAAWEQGGRKKLQAVPTTIFNQGD